jgi:hypothetical protein
MDWICDLPKYFPKEAKFIGFGLSYDITQLLNDLPFAVAWEIQNKKPFRERSYPPDRQRPASVNHVAIWHAVRPDGTRVAYAINYLKGKWLKVGRCANPDQIFKTNKKREVHYDTGKPITICDVFGYFQLSFQGALHGMKKNIGTTGDELALIEWGKPLRGDFSHQPLEKIKAYTEAELKLTCRMMNAVHAGLKQLGAKITKWHGPGPVAKFFLNAKGIAPSKEHPGHYPELRSVDPRKPQKWAHHAFFGGRIELIKQGTHKGKLYGCDICSAYPAAMVDLPSMRDGKWKTHRARNLSLDELKALAEGFSRVSMVRVKFDFGTSVGTCQHDFYPLPFRQEDGAAIFPQNGEGHLYA